MTLDPTKTDYSFDELLTVSDTASTTPSSTGQASQSELDEIFQKFRQYKTPHLPDNPTTKSQFIASIVYLAQCGTTSPNFNENRSCPHFGFAWLTAGIARNIMRSVNRSLTFRKVARSYRKEAIAVAKRFELEGNLAKAYKLDNPTATMEQLIYVSDFNTFSDDPTIPSEVRNWLLQNFKKRFKKDA